MHRFVKLSVTDVQRIKELFVSVFTKEPWMDDWSDGNQLDQYIIDLIGNPNSLAFGYEEGKELIAVSMGYIKHWWQGTEYIINELCVKTGLQGHGVGGRFVEDIEGYLRENDIKGVFLLTDRDVPAYGFYRHCGFVEQENTVAFAKWV